MSNRLDRLYDAQLYLNDVLLGLKFDWLDKLSEAEFKRIIERITYISDEIGQRYPSTAADDLRARR